MVHVLDASKSVVVCSALLATEDQRDDFLDAVREDYEEIRSDYYDNVKDKKYVTLAESRKRKYKLDWAEFEPVRPTFLGRRVLHNYDLRKLVGYIDWKPFFDTWPLRGKYPNRGYPKIFTTRRSVPRPSACSRTQTHSSTCSSATTRSPPTPPCSIYN